MLTWAPVEITNFCYVIGVTKERFFLVSTKIEEFWTKNSIKSLSANACGYLKFITMVRSLHKRWEIFAGNAHASSTHVSRSVPWLLKLTNDQVYFTVDGVY